MQSVPEVRFGAVCGPDRVQLREGVVKAEHPVAYLVKNKDLLLGREIAHESLVRWSAGRVLLYVRATCRDTLYGFLSAAAFIA